MFDFVWMYRCEWEITMGVETGFACVDLFTCALDDFLKCLHARHDG
jgi:hypothetical protein